MPRVSLNQSTPDFSMPLTVLAWLIFAGTLAPVCGKNIKQTMNKA